MLFCASPVYLVQNYIEDVAVIIYFLCAFGGIPANNDSEM